MNRKQIAWKITTHISVVVWMIVIFCFSAQPGDESADLSGGVSHMFMTILNHVLHLGWEELEVLEMTAIWDYPIRKLAHMTEFGILAVLLWLAAKCYVQMNSTKRRYIGAWMGAVCYAATDEFHQLFVPERSGNLFDVCVDATGALIALLLAWGISNIYRMIRKR